MNNIFSKSKKRAMDPEKNDTQEKKIDNLRQKKINRPRRDFLLVLPLKDRILFIKQLSILIKAGVPLFNSLIMIREQAKSNSMKKILDKIVRDVENGQYLSTAMAKFKKVFGELTVNIISIGEVSGNLSENLNHLVTILKKRQALNRKIVGASVYPIFIIIATLGISIMLTVFVFPKIIPVLKSINYDLPVTTKILIFLSDVIKAHGPLIGIVIISSIVIFFLLLKLKKFHFLFDEILLRIPLINHFAQSYNIANTCRTLGLLLGSGITIVKSFQIASNTTKNLVYKKELNNIADKIVKGEVPSANMKNKKLFPPMVSQMVKVGETTGRLSDTFTYLADIYEEDVDDMTSNLSSTIEPLLLVFMGVLVGFIAISIITPIYGITQHLTPN